MAPPVLIINWGGVMGTGALIGIPSFVIGLTTLMMGIKSHNRYCMYIKLECNVSKINWVSTWTPLNKNLIDCVYKGHLDLSLANNESDVTNCFYDNRADECPTESCPDISGDNFSLMMVGILIAVIPIILYYIIFGICTWHKSRKYRRERAV